MVQAQGKVIALDLSGHTGFCISSHGAIETVGEWNLADNWWASNAKGKRVKRDGPLGHRCSVLMNQLIAAVEGQYYFSHIVYEEVCRWSGFSAAHCYGAYRGVVHMFAQRHPGIQLVPYSVGEIKKHATGKGNADKGMMIDAAAKRWPRAFAFAPIPFTDNMADAMHIADLHWSKTHADQRLRDTTHI